MAFRTKEVHWKTARRDVSFHSSSTPVTPGDWEHGCPVARGWETLEGGGKGDGEQGDVALAAVTGPSSR